MASLIFFLLSGCTTRQKLSIPPPEVPVEEVEKQPERLHPDFEGLARAAQLLQQGDYDGSLIVNLDVLAMSRKPIPILPILVIGGVVLHPSHQFGNAPGKCLTFG
jgi:1-acyl-sn-glycerol-3-phosphate acyltransferase